MNAGLTLDAFLRRAENVLDIVWNRVVWKLALGDHRIVEVVAIVSDAAPELFS